MRSALVVLLALAPACAIAQAGSAPIPAADYTRQVAGITVLDRDGAAYHQPFLGGFDVPRPQLVDIDGDGDLDLFLQERSGELVFFEREGDRWTWRTDQFQDLDVGEWFRFVDLDGDGLWDLLGETRYSHVRAWRNTGTRSEPRLVLAADSLRDADGRAIFADRQNILNLADIDCNGRLDLFIGRVTGTIDHLEAEPVPGPDGLPRFRLVTERWEGIEIIGPVPGQDLPPRVGGPSALPNGSRHGANTMAFGDIDGDGDLDLFWGDFFEQGILLIANNGGCPHYSLREQPRQFPVGDPVLTTGYNAPAPGDIDGDGDLDLLLGVIGGAFTPSRSSVENLYLLEQFEPGQFRVATSRLVPTIDVGSESNPVLADIDGDGDLDLLLGSKIDPADNQSSFISWFENTGTAGAPVLAERGDLGIRGDFHLSPVVADLDGDGQPEIITGGWQDQVHWWRNTGAPADPQWRRADSALVVITRGSNTTPAVGDLDGDGLPDLVVGEASGAINLYRNTGSRSAPVFTLVSDEFQHIDVGRRSAPHLADFDGDGKLDLLIGAEDGSIRLWRNITAAPGEFAFEPVPGWLIQSDPLATPTSGDLTGSGKAVIMAGTASGGVRYFEP